MYFEIQIDRPTQTSAGDLFCSPDWLSSGFIVRNNVIQHHRARGIIVKADDGLIENNQLEDITASAISLGPEFAFWLEGDYVRNVIVRNNTITQAGIGGNCVSNLRAIQVGAITLSALSPKGKLPQTFSNQQVIIEGNTLKNSGGIGMLITCAQNVRIVGNHIGKTQFLGHFEGGKSHDIDPAAAIFVDQARNVFFENNILESGTVIEGKNVQKDSTTGKTAAQSSETTSSKKP